MNQSNKSLEQTNQTNKQIKQVTSQQTNKLTNNPINKQPTNQQANNKLISSPTNQLDQETNKTKTPQKKKRKRNKQPKTRNQQTKNPPPQKKKKKHNKPRRPWISNDFDKKHQVTFVLSKPCSHRISHFGKDLFEKRQDCLIFMSLCGSKPWYPKEHTMLVFRGIIYFFLYCFLWFFTCFDTPVNSQS